MQYSSCGNPDKTETKPCKMPICCGDLIWSEWSGCSYSNGKVSIKFFFTNLNHLNSILVPDIAYYTGKVSVCNLR